MRPLHSSLVVLGVTAVALAASAQSPAAGSAPAGRSSVAGTVFDSLVANRALAGATVWIVGTPHTVVTDQKGRYRFDGLPAGAYTLTFSDLALDSLGVSAPTVDVVLADGAVPEVALATPSPVAFYAAACGAAPPPDAGVVLGIVRDAAGARPVAGAQVSAEWVEWRLENGGMHQSDAKVGVAADGSGRYVLCGVPSDVAVVLRAATAGAASGAVEVDMGGRAFTTRDLGLAAVAGDAPTPGAAMLVGSLTTAEGEPVARGQVHILGVEGRVATTDSAGSFTLSGLPAGTHTLEARALGFVPVRVAVDLRERQVTRTAPRFGERVVVLSREQITARSAAIEARMRRVTGQYITREQIERSNALDLNDVLRFSPRLAVSAGSGNPSSRRSAGRCAPAYYLDGVELSPGGNLSPDYNMSTGRYTPPGGTITPDQVVTARDVDLVEVYGEGASPVQSVRSSGCGALMVWTRDSLPDGRRSHSNRQ